MIVEFLKANGWTPMPNMPVYYVNSSGGLAVDLSGDYGYAWELLRVDDEGRMDNIGSGVEGDTLEELKEALN